MWTTAPRQADWFGVVVLGVVFGADGLGADGRGADGLDADVLGTDGAGAAPRGASRGAGVEPHAADAIIVAIATTANGVKRWNERLRMTVLLC